MMTIADGEEDTAKLGSGVTNVGLQGERQDDGRGELQSAEEASAYFASIGPWYSAASVRQYCAISDETLECWRADRLVLGVEFADGQHYYPVQQFVDGRRVRGLAQVLDMLEPAYVTPETQVAWLAGPAYENESPTRWDLLRAGELELILRWAVEDAARVLGL